MSLAIVIAAVIILILLYFCWRGLQKRAEHEFPGHGVAGQFGLRDFRTYEQMCGEKHRNSKVENFYSSGSDLRYRTEADTSTEITIPNSDFNKRELSYYIRR
jgi:hypothetical protein